MYVVKFSTTAHRHIFNLKDSSTSQASRMSSNSPISIVHIRNLSTEFRFLHWHWEVPTGRILSALIITFAIFGFFQVLGLVLEIFKPQKALSSEAPEERQLGVPSANTTIGKGGDHEGL
ncbi:hypothetical protein D9758_001620 [Tetrapyrgos nigripes]|uniref:Uncharacterized protein n=1 Tax=Tetrapyrgos nigripes TaxID=182062 RepID=A0A8H5GY02_9AGAR|nr:hypothetical protein D9758_001620 [Tetrapyrgos nigripes]